MSSAEAADLYLRRAQLDAALAESFRRRPLTPADAERIALIAGHAADTVAAAGSADPADIAACATMYGYGLGYWQARRELEAPR